MPVANTLSYLASSIGTKEKNVLCHQHLIKGFLHRAVFGDELFGGVFVAVVDELEVHVDEHRVKDEGQLVPVEVEAALNEFLKVLKLINKHKLDT